MIYVSLAITLLTGKIEWLRLSPALCVVTNFAVAVWAFNDRRA